METVPLRCAIVDDEPLAIQILKEYIAEVPQLQLVATANDPIKALQILNESPVDLLFLDIEMPKMSGLDLIKSTSIRAQVILTTAYRDYALESYDVDAVDYLLKPISFVRFMKAVGKVMRHHKAEAHAQPQSGSTMADFSKGAIYVYSDKKNIKVHFEDILYLESLKDYVRFHTESKPIVSKGTISKYEELLPSYFLRIHRSFIVNTHKITAFTHQDVEIRTKEIPIGKSYKSKVIEHLKQ